MSTTHSPLPANYSWISPYMMVTNIDTATDFYAHVFGFSLREKASGEDGTACHAEMQYQNQLIMFGKEGHYNGEESAKSPKTSHVKSPISLYIYCENVDKFFESATAKGAQTISAPEDMFWGDRVCRVQCPEGYIWAFATHLGVPCQNKK